MNPLQALARWLDIRPHEYRTFGVSALGAFLVLSFLVVARSLREAFFITEFSVESVPYITMATAILTFPSVALFGRILAGHDPKAVFRFVLLGLSLAVAGTWATVSLSPDPTIVRAAIVAFYLVTAIGVLLLTSGFWILTSEYFALRDAKRLFGMISGGGTLGATLAAASVNPLGDAMGQDGLVALLVLLLLVLYPLQGLMPKLESEHEHVEEPGGGGIREGLTSVLSEPHLRLLAGVVAAATMASYLVDYQFKELASARFPEAEELAGFLAIFYGVTGAISLFLQVFVASQLLGAAGVAATLAVLPMALLLGATGLLLLPSLLTVTLVRGADNSIRKSLHRSVLEYLWVPVPAGLRRRTKTFIDSVVDSGAEGLAALLVAVWIGALALPARGLTVFVVVLCLAFIGLARAMGRQYFRTLITRLEEGQEEIADPMVQSQLVGGEMTMTVTQLDVQAALTQTGLLESLPGREPVRAAPLDPGPENAGSTTERLRSPDPSVVSAALDDTDDWGPRHVEPLTRLLARDPFYRRAGDVLAGLGNAAVRPLADLLVDEATDFVVRRRIPRVLARIDEPAAEDALLQGVGVGRFEVRYRCAVALARRRNKRMPGAGTDGDETIWAAIRSELGHERPIWELQKLLDNRPSSDGFVTDKVYGRGELSLEHTFRLLSLVLDPDPIRTAFHGIVHDDQKLKSISLEFLEQVLPPDVRERLWPFIGDISEHQRQRQIRDMDDVVADLLRTGATLFADPAERARLIEALERDDEQTDD